MKTPRDERGVVSRSESTEVGEQQRSEFDRGTAKPQLKPLDEPPRDCEVRIIVRGKPLSRFGCVPDLLTEDKQLTLAARLVLAWVVGRPKNHKLYISQMINRIGASPGSWRTIAGCLTEAGIYTAKRVGGGKSTVGWDIRFDLSRYYPEESSDERGR